MNKHAVYFISLLVLILSCVNPKTELQQTEQAVQAEQSLKEANSVIELDNGQK